MPPTITALNPSSGPPAGNNTVVITGTGFTGPASVFFGGTATTFTINSTTQITAIAPAGTGTVQVTVVTPDGVSAGFPYFYAGPPTLSGANPTQGPSTGGTAVTLTGTNLGGATAVRFGTTPATSFTVVSATQITAVAPSGTGSVQITVVTGGGTSNGVAFSYVVGPQLTGVNPNSGPLAGGTAVTLTGTNFTGATAVRFGTTPATSFTVVSATQITAVAPAGSAGAVDVTVVTPGGAATLAKSFFYLDIPALSGISPSAGPLAGGTTVTLTGTGLSGVTAVRFGTTPATSFTAVSTTQVTAVAPAGSAGTVGVSVVTPGGTTNTVAYTYMPVATITVLTPDVGPVTGGTIVTITGANLAQTASVLFGATSAGFTVFSDNQIVTNVPAGSAGPVAVTVVTPGGTSAAATYTRIAPPAI
ncbi:IPT/TIG domain-containing protein [Nocardia bovistercoris]|uniref:IPT/TIG domain-containing protein n=1 Tax=Nocardia bovistercoris TaxID=2785916 RepID=A0A931ICA9_9NOCA|nr:IPT/TIG domain-containing protein [Nocardia bovistercoris]MBH0777916.1 IPT/TIG domain-containing protein [Nocardia bovistercoris]